MKSSDQHMMKKANVIYMNVVMKDVLELVDMDTKKDRWNRTTLFDPNDACDKVKDAMRNAELANYCLI